MTLEEIKSKWDWIKHPEGGYFYPKYMSKEGFEIGSPKREQKLYSSIYFLIEKNDPSMFHQLVIDEMWHFYDGDSLKLHEIEKDGTYRCTILGVDDFQYLVRKNTWMAAECSGSKGFSLFGCTLSPAYTADKFKMGERQKLLLAFPHLASIVSRLTLSEV